MREHGGLLCAYCDRRWHSYHFFFFFFPRHRCLTRGFPEPLPNYSGCCCRWLYLYIGMSLWRVYVCKIKKKKSVKTPLMHGSIHISLILFFLCILRLLWCALSCQCVQADLFSWCMHNLVVMKPPWRRGATKAQEAYVCVWVRAWRLSWVQPMCHHIGCDETTKPRKQAAVYDTDMVAAGSWHSHLLSHIVTTEHKSTIAADNIVLD